MSKEINSSQLNQLDEQSLARLVLAQKPVNPPHLPLDSLQAIADSALDLGLQVGLGARVHEQSFRCGFRETQGRRIYTPMGYNAQALKEVP